MIAPPTRMRVVMNTTDLIIPTTLDKLKQGLGDAILREGFSLTQRTPPDFVLRAGAGKNNADAANAWLAQHRDGITELQWISQRALDELTYCSADNMMSSFMSDLMKEPQAAMSFLTASPMGYLSDLVKAAIVDSFNFAQLLRLFLKLPH